MNEIYPYHPHLGYMCDNSYWYDGEYENDYGETLNRMCMPCEHPLNGECSASSCGDYSCSMHCIDADGEVIPGNSCYNAWPTVWNKNTEDPSGNSSYYSPLKFQYILGWGAGDGIYYEPDMEGYPENWDELYLLKTDQSWYPVATCLLYTSPSPRDGLLSRMPSSA